MAVLKLYRNKLQQNHQFLKQHFDATNIDWGVVTKLLCGNATILREVLNLGVREVHDSRVSNLRAVKKLDASVQTVYIKPPPKRAIKSIVECADVSFNSEFETIRLLSEEAVRQEKVHKVIIMVELGDLREGVMGEELVAFYAKVFELPGVEIIGLGTNLNCLHGVMPSQDKLIQLSLYKQIIELKFDRKIPWISGGTTVTFPLLLSNRLPPGINHFRVGEALFFGKNLFTGKTIAGMKDDVFELEAQIIELTKKPVVPIGELGENPYGDEFEVDEEDYGKRNVRAILDVGTLDISTKFLRCTDKKIEVVGASSDMLVVDLGQNQKGRKVGDVLRFKLQYMGALHLLNSDYIDKKVVLPEANTKNRSTRKNDTNTNAPTASPNQEPLPVSES